MEKVKSLVPLSSSLIKIQIFHLEKCFFYMMMMNSWVNTFFAQTLVKKKIFFVTFYTDNLPFS